MLKKKMAASCRRPRHVQHPRPACMTAAWPTHPSGGSTAAGSELPRRVRSLRAPDDSKIDTSASKARSPSRPSLQNDFGDSRAPRS